jgi:dipeptidyl aminopeptidase/acylaminoacyl peptidase
MIGSRVLVVDTTTGETQEPFPSGNTSWGAQWSPDGSRLAAYVQYEGPACLWIWERETGNLHPLPQAIVRSSFGFEAPQWTPDGRALVVKLWPASLSVEHSSERDVSQPGSPTVTVFSFDPAGEGEEADIPLLKRFDKAHCDLGWVDAKTGDVRQLVTDWAMVGWRVAPDGQAVALLRIIDLNEKCQQTYFNLTVVPLDGRPPQVIANRIPQNFGICFNWSPDSRYLAYTTAERGQKGRLFLVAADGSEIPRDLTGDRDIDLTQNYEGPRFSEDGRTIYCLGSDGIWAFDTDDSSAREITAELNRRVRFWIQRPTNGTLWTPDGATLLVSTFDSATKREGLARVDLASGQGTVITEFEWRCWGAFGMEATPDGSTCYLVTEAADRPPEIWRVAGDFRTPQRLFLLNPDLEDVALSTACLIEWRAPDGQTRQGALLLPPTYVEGERVPLIVQIYGGKIASDIVHQFGFGGHWVDNAQLLASRGYAVLYPDLPLENRDPLRQLPAQVLPAVNRVIDLGIADPERLGLMGHSYGGYCVLALLTQTMRFRAAVCSAGTVNLTSVYGTLTVNGDSQWLGWSESGQARLGGSPWERREAYIENSPLFYMDRIRTPVLLVHGSEDIGMSAQAGEAFSALRRLGQRVELRRYRGEGHWPGTWSETNLRDVCERVLGWFDEHLNRAQGD